MMLLNRSLQVLKFKGKTNAVLSTVEQYRSVKRWVAPTLRELRKRSKKMGVQPQEKRSQFLEWNYGCELFAFGKRLNEEFQIPILQTAFTSASYIEQERARQAGLGIENPQIDLCANDELATRGRYIAEIYINRFLKLSLPKVPEEGLEAIRKYLLSDTILSEIGFSLGMKDLLLDDEYPPSTKSMANSFLAVIGALERSSNLERAYIFVRDFICTKLNQQDLMDLWTINDPEEMLKKVCKERNIAEPEARLIGDCSKQTVLATYFVGMFSNKQLIGKGYGEDVATAVKTASLNALQTIFDIHDNRKPFNFNINFNIDNQPALS